MKFRIEAPTTGELDVAEARLRLLFEMAEGSPDFRNRRRDQGDERARDSRRYFNQVVPADGLTVYAVVYGNYEPAETHSLWATEALAEQQIERLDGSMWEVVPWGIGTSLPAATP